jgi:hypothetical protein
MAGHTTNINLSKPTYSEDADIAVINSNMDIIDGKMGAVGSTSVQAQLNTASTNITNLGKDLCAVVAGKQSTTGAATGEYVIVRGSTISGISDGAYIAAKTIPANTNLDSSYFSSTGMTKGIANSLNAKISTLDYSKTLSSSDDLNTIPNGTYNIVAGNIPANCPVSNNSTVETFGQGQRFQIIVTASSGVVYTYQRRYYQSWGNWEQLALKSDLKYETRTINTTLANGAGYSIDIADVPSGYVPIAVTNVSVTFSYAAVLTSPRIVSGSWKVGSWSSQANNTASGVMGVLFAKT